MALYQKKTYISDPIEIRTLRIGNFAAQIENDPEGLIPGTKAECDQRKILRLVAGSKFSWVVRENSKIKALFCGIFLRLFI